MKFLLVVWFLLLSGCANLQPAEAPVYRWTDVHLFGVTAIAFSHDGRMLASGGHRGEIAVWDVATRARIANAGGYGEPVRALQWLDGALVSADRNGLALWRAADLTALKVAATSPAVGLALTDSRLYSVHRDGNLRAWETDLTPLASVQTGGELIAVAAHGLRLAIASQDGDVGIYDSQLRQLAALKNRGAAAHDLHFSADGRTLFGGSWFRLLAWDVASGRAAAVAAEHNGLLTSLDISRDNRWIATLGRHTDSAIRIWQRDDYRIVRRLAAHELCGAMIRFSPDGRYLASASDDETIALFDLAAPPLK